MSRNLHGPSTDAVMTSVVVRGNAYQCGLQYGKALGTYLEAFYGWFVRKEPREVLHTAYRAVLEKMEAATARHFPRLLDEIKGWSDGAGLDHDKCRILAFHNEITNVLPPNCSNLIVTKGPEGPWLGRNCDLHADERSWQIRKVSYCSDGHSTLLTGYVGLPGGMGINEAGLCLGGSSLPAATGEVPEGLPNYTHFLLAAQASIRDCCDQFEKIGFLGKGLHLALLDASGEAAAVELGAGRIHVRRPNEHGWLVVTNHSPTRAVPAPSMTNDLENYHENSIARFNRLTTLLETSHPTDWTAAWGQRALADHAESTSVCQHVPNGYHTIYSFTLRPGKPRQRMDLCWGYPCRGVYTASEL